MQMIILAATEGTRPADRRPTAKTPKPAVGKLAGIVRDEVRGGRVNELRQLPSGPLSLRERVRVRVI